MQAVMKTQRLWMVSRTVATDRFRQLAMQSPNSETLSPPDSAVAPAPDFRGRWWIRIALFVLHIAILVAAMSLTPPGYFFELGAFTGSILLFSSILLWGLLCSVKTRREILLYCVLALVQAGFMALVGLHFRAEDRALQPIMNELAIRRIEWASQMEPFRMDTLFEMTSGKRQLSVEELRELQTRARAAKAKLSELQSEAMRAIAEAESRLAAVSSGAARDFRRGVESTRPESDETMKLMQDYFAEIEQLTGLLIDQQGRYSQTTNGLVFTRDEDAQAFNKQLDTIARLQEQLNSRGRKANQALPKVPSTQ
ncbi:MAG TPA: hypothetical protein VIX11_06580 [Candidatus Acidoferrum sp.]